MKLFPDFQDSQVISCFWPIFGLLRHVEQCAKETLAHILRDMHDIKAMRPIIDWPVVQVPENRPRFPYPHQRIWCLSLLSRRWALFPIFQQLIDFRAFPLTWGPRVSSVPLNRSPRLLHSSFVLVVSALELAYSCACT